MFVSAWHPEKLCGLCSDRLKLDPGSLLDMLSLSMVSSESFVAPIAGCE